MTTQEAIEAVIKEDVRCDIHGDLYGVDRAAEYIAGVIDEKCARIEELETEVKRLTQKFDKLTEFLRRALIPERYPNTMFIHALVGEKDQNGMPEKILIVPAYGVDFSYVYENTGKTTGTEW